MTEHKFMGRCPRCHFLTTIDLAIDKQETHTACVHCNATVKVERLSTPTEEGETND